MANKKISQLTDGTPLTFTTDHIPIVRGGVNYKALITALNINTAVGKIDQATGYTLAGGTTSKTLTVSEDSTINQNLSTTSNVLFNTLQSTDYIGQDEVAAASVTPPAEGYKIFANLDDNGHPYVRDKAGNLYDLVSGIADGLWSQTGTTLFPKDALSVKSITIKNTAQTESFNLSHEDTYINYNASNAAHYHRFDQQIQAQTSIKLNNTGTLTSAKGISLWGGDDNYKIGFDDVGGTVGYNRYNVAVAGAVYGHIWSAGSIASPTTLGLLNGLGQLRIFKNDGWPAVVAGQSGTDQFVAGYLSGYATIGGHNSTLSAWTDLIIQPASIVVGSKTGIGLYNGAGGQVPNATLHSVGTTILGCSSTANIDADLYASNVNIYVDEGTDTAYLKIKYSNGTTVNNFPIPLTNTISQNKRSVTFASSAAEKKNLVTDDIIYVDASGGAVIIEIDPTIIERPVTVVNHVDGGLNSVQIQAAAGKFIMGLTTPISLNNEGTNATVIGGPPTSPYGYIVGSGIA